MTFEELKKEIREYESDTFSASGEEMSDEEIAQVAEKLISYFVDNRLDGVLLSAMLEGVRL